MTLTSTKSPYLLKRPTPTDKTSHQSRDSLGHFSPEVWHLSWTRQDHLRHTATFQRSGATTSPAPLHCMSCICCASTGMENCQLCCYPQTWKEVLLTSEIIAPNFTPVMLWKTPGINCGKATVPNGPDVWGNTSIADGSPT